MVVQAWTYTSTSVQLLLAPAIKEFSSLVNASGTHLPSRQESKQAAKGQQQKTKHSSILCIEEPPSNYSIMASTAKLLFVTAVWLAVLIHGSQQMPLERRQADDCTPTQERDAILGLNVMRKIFINAYRVSIIIID